MLRLLLRRRRRRVSACFAAVVLAVSACFVQMPRSNDDAAWEAPAHAPVLANIDSTKRPPSRLEQRSPLYFYKIASVVFEQRPRRWTSVQIARATCFLPPARMRYRRVTHDADGEPPA